MVPKIVYDDLRIETRVLHMADDMLSYLTVQDYNFLWLVVIGLFFLLSIAMMAKLKNKETLPSTKRLYLGYAVFLIVLAVSRLFNQISNFYRDTVGDEDPTFQLIKRSSYVLGLLAFAFLIFGFERHFLKMIVNTRGIFTLIPLIIGIIGIIPVSIDPLTFLIDYKTLRTINYVGIGINMVMIASLYIYVASKSTGNIRRAAINSIIGIAFIGIGFLLNSSAVDELFGGYAWLLNLIGASMNIVGALFVYKSTKQEKVAKKEENKNWSVETPPR